MASNYNKGLVAGVLAADPHKATDGVTLITLRIIDDRINPATKKRNVFYPNFVMYGREAENALKHLVKGQEIQLDYKIETRKKEVNGEPQYFTNHVVTSSKWGKRPELPVGDLDEPKEDN